MLPRLDVLNCSNLLMAWARVGLYSPELLDKIAEEIMAKHKEKLFYEEGAYPEVSNIM